VTLVTHVSIIGSSRTLSPAMRDYARRAVQRAQARGFTVLVGDHPSGVEAVVRDECRRLKTPVVVVGVGRFPRCGARWLRCYLSIGMDSCRGSKGRLLDPSTVLNRWLADNSQIGLFLWDCVDRSTKTAYDYMIHCGRDAHLIRF